MQDLDKRRDRGPSYLSSAADEGSLVFLLAVGPFAGLCQWVEPDEGAVWRGPLNWRPQSDDMLFDIHRPFSGCNRWDEEAIEFFTHNQFTQTLYVIDMKTFKCVTLFWHVFPGSMHQMGNSYRNYADSKPTDVMVYSGGIHDETCDFFATTTRLAIRM